MKLQQTCVCGAKFIGITEHADNHDNEEDLFKRYDAFNARHSSCTKMALGIHKSQKIRLPGEIVASIKKVFPSHLRKS